jgi:DGQHR domain-containing protein
MVEFTKVDAWVLQVSEKFAEVTQFFNSEYYEGFAEWEESTWSVLEPYIEDVPRELIMEEIYIPLKMILSNALEEISWSAQGEPAFLNRMETLIYPDAWILWNQRRWNIVSDLIPSVKERNLAGEDVFYFDSDAELNTLKIPMRRVNVSPGATVYVGNALASSLHLACDVPAIPSTISAAETVSRVLDPDLERNQWQRSLISNRVKHISSFLQTGNNFFVNPVIIHLDEDADQNHAIINTRDQDKPVLEIYFNNICDEGYLEGHKRPLKLIDGQHRVRGAARSNMGNTLEIPFVLIPNTYSPDHAARLFTEINTTSKELDKDHQLFLAYRFKISHHDRDLTMGQYIAGDKNTYYDRANRLAYEMAARLSSVGSVLDSQIQMLKANGTRNSVDITKWLKYAKKWFLPSGPYGPECSLSKDEIEEELENYFSAWVSIIGNSWIQANESGWNSRTIFQQKTHFRVLLTRFIQVHELTKARFDNDLLTENDFRFTLKPLSNIKSASTELKSVYFKTSEFYWQCMDAWVTDAIDNGEAFSESEVMSKNHRSMPGKGILSFPADPEHWIIIDDERGNWPDNRTKYLQLIRPKNCHTTLKIQILNGEEVLTGVSRKTINAPNSDGYYKVPIRVGLIPENVDEIQVRLEWKTAVTPIEHTISVRKQSMA